MSHISIYRLHLFTQLQDNKMLRWKYARLSCCCSGKTRCTEKKGNPSKRRTRTSFKVTPFELAADCILLLSPANHTLDIRVPTYS